MASIHFRFTQERKRRRLSQEALAQIAGVRLETIRALEEGTARAMRFSTLARICEVLNCQPGDLFEVHLDEHSFPALGGPDEDEIVRARRTNPGALLDGPATMADILGSRSKNQMPA